MSIKLLTELGKRLRLVRGMTGLSKKDFCQKHGISLSTFNYWQYIPAAKLTAKGAQKLVTALLTEGISCQADWLIHGYGIFPFFTDTIGATITKIPSKKVSPESTINQDLFAELVLFNQLYHQTTIMAMTDDSMSPFCEFGDHLGGIKLSKNNWSSAINKICLIETAEQQLYCRKLLPGSTTRTFHLYCLNLASHTPKPIIYDVKILNIAPVIRIWKNPTAPLQHANDTKHHD